MEAYIKYKAWWIETQSPHILSEHRNSEEMFEDHVNLLGLYNLMEALIQQEVPGLEEAVASLENEVEQIKDTIGQIDTSNDWRR
jgi:hypothetical protein|tara:strand:+ start:1571 stop:1822 length:252 start_codon:yes stop_codon:yes gene_type:complete